MIPIPSSTPLPQSKIYPLQDKPYSFKKIVMTITVIALLILSGLPALFSSSINDPNPFFPTCASVTPVRGYYEGNTCFQVTPLNAEEIIANLRKVKPKQTAFHFTHPAVLIRHCRKVIKNGSPFLIGADDHPSVDCEIPTEIQPYYKGLPSFKVKPRLHAIPRYVGPTLHPGLVFFREPMQYQIGPTRVELYYGFSLPSSLKNYKQVLKAVQVAPQFRMRESDGWNWLENEVGKSGSRGTKLDIENTDENSKDPQATGFYGIDPEEVSRYENAVASAWKRIQHIDTMSVNDLIKMFSETHKEMMEGNLPTAGFYRTTKIEVSGKNADGSCYRDMSFPEPENVPELVTLFAETMVEMWVRSQHCLNFNPLAETLAFLHCRYTAIHPYDDGSGREARIISGVMSMLFGLPYPIFPNHEEYSRFIAANNLNPGAASKYMLKALKWTSKMLQRRSCLQGLTC